MNALALEYERDFHSWIEKNIHLLKTGQVHDLDKEHLIEELEGMANRDRNELVSHLIILIAHLLKWQFQFDQLSELYQNFRGASWRATIAEQRKQITRQIKLNPSLKSFFAQAIIESYTDAVDLAVDETGLPESAFPQNCPYSIEQLLDKTFYPTSNSV